MIFMALTRINFKPIELQCLLTRRMLRDSELAEKKPLPFKKVSKQFVAIENRATPSLKTKRAGHSRTSNVVN
jgi:hypothetical protein